ncbi:cellulase family glycosylhydrolase [Pleomorphovibrio marinus]|uniref:cellulase family glycosylhydrolase n=1 Tax=Pleomorphovibrio marinus TaxID=2164132 RepID=UPI000E0AF428|nr:cellulase family glycosylhydrolase [Pleomorphovibrio marinus]
MDFHPKTRRDFLKNAALLTAGVGLGMTQGGYAHQLEKPKNKLPKWRGFNLLDFFSPDADKGRKNKEEYFKWMEDWGFDFVRIPISYPSYLKFDRSRAIKPDETLNFDENRLQEIDSLVEMAHKYNLHVSLNLHRAPGFCINAGFEEPFNLWEDKEAQEAFAEHWKMWAKRYKNISPKKMSFDLVNEPFKREDPNNQHSPGGPVPVEEYRQVAKVGLDAIRTVDKKRLVISNGNGGGGTAVPEIADLDLGQSCRGYFPSHISHYKASWVYQHPEDLPSVEWPGEYNERYYGREDVEKHYAPWVALIKKGVGVHCGECGCYNKTPHDVFLAWFGDVLGVLHQNGIGFGLWEFSGTFGLLNSGRADVDYEDWYGEKLDRKLLTLLQKYA